MQLTQGPDRSGAIVTRVLLALVLAVGMIAQSITVANGIYLITTHFSPSDIVSVPGQTPGQIRARGYIAMSVGVLPLILGLAAGAFARASGIGWRRSLKRAAVFAASADVLVLAFAILTSM